MSELDHTIGSKRHRVMTSLSIHPSQEIDTSNPLTVVPNKDSILAKRVLRHQIKAIKSGVIGALSRGMILIFLIFLYIVWPILSIFLKSKSIVPL